MEESFTNHNHHTAYNIRIWVICLLFFCFALQGMAQITDTSKIKKHSPKKAALMSACLPGLGQYYNRKYWKIPVIYAGVAAITYFAIRNSDSLKNYKQAYVFRMDGDTLTGDNYLKYTADQIKQLRDYYRRNLELTFIIGTAVYALNIIDATVDAHLFDFDIDDNLSMKVSPFFIPAKKYSYAGLSFSLTFGKSKPHKIINN